MTPIRCSRPKRNPRARVTVPEHVGPHVKLVFSEMARLGVTYDEVEIGSGVRRAAIKAWRKKNRPGLESLEAVLGWLGWDFVAVPRAKTVPPEIEAELQAIADKHGWTMERTFAALVEIMMRGRAARASAPKPDNDNVVLERAAG